VPPPEIASVLDPIRERLDPVSAATFGAHITVTPPFAAAPSAADEERVETAIRIVTSMRLQLDRPTRFSGSSVVYLPVVPSHGVHALRTALLATGLFRLDLPHTSDFVPHLTLSEFGSAPDEAFRLKLPQPKAMAFPRHGHVGCIRRAFPPCDARSAWLGRRDKGPEPDDPVARNHRSGLLTIMPMPPNGAPARDRERALSRQERRREAGL
jgi:2'-5' RNA ligase